MTPARCHCGRALPDPDADGLRTCPRCYRLYDSASTLPACRHSKTKWLDGDRSLYRVRCRECKAVWREVPIDEVRT